MEVIVRPVKIEDAEQINEFKIAQGVFENMLTIPSARIIDESRHLEKLTGSDHVLVAEISENGYKKVVGLVVLSVNRALRQRHCGEIGIMIHPDYQGKGIAKALMNKIIDVSDNWLMLKRVELTTFVDNKKSINLYKAFGFEVEGTKKSAAIKNGKYTDLYMMARVL